MGSRKRRAPALSRTRGFTLIELIVVISVVALLTAVALDRLLRYQELGERTAVEQTIASINSALTLKFAAYIAMGQPQAVAGEVGKNPVNLLERPPSDYLGELYSPNIKSLPRPTWYFDRQAGELVYLPHRNRYLTLSEGPPEALRFRIILRDVVQVPGAPRELAQPFIAASQPFNWVIE
jgi:general secretion pathway protein G